MADNKKTSLRSKVRRPKLLLVFGVAVLALFTVALAAMLMSRRAPESPQENQNSAGNSYSQNNILENDAKMYLTDITPQAKDKLKLTITGSDNCQGLQPGIVVYTPANNQNYNDMRINSKTKATVYGKLKDYQDAVDVITGKVKLSADQGYALKAFQIYCDDSVNLWTNELNIKYPGMDSSRSFIGSTSGQAVGSGYLSFWVLGKKGDDIILLSGHMTENEIPAEYRGQCKLATTGVNPTYIYTDMGACLKQVFENSTAFQEMVNAELQELTEAFAI
jgi:hypothetical protein